MTSTRRVRQGDVVLLDTPFPDDTGSKMRPGVIVSTEGYHRGRRDVLIASLTGNISRRLAGKYVLLDWALAGLDRSSAISGQMETVARSRLGRRIGSVSNRDMAGIVEALKEIFGMAD